MPSPFAGSVATWLLKTFGLEVLVLLKEGLESQWRRLFASRSVLVLGAPQTGKSSLATFLREGRPYEVVDGQIRPPDPTAAAVIVDKKFALQKGNWLRLARDLPGDADLRATWETALTEVRPAGIVYMIDGRLDEAGLRAAVGALFDDVLAFYAKAGGTRELLALHVFVNHCDALGGGVRERAALATVTDEFEARRSGRPELEALRFAASATQLSPNRRAWPEVTRALHRFGADLLE
jgi:hypothetical protein